MKKSNYPRNYPVWVLIFFIGISIIVSFIQSYGSKDDKSSDEVTTTILNSPLASPLGFNDQEKGPILLEILSPISYIGGNYVETGVKSWVAKIEAARKDPKVTGLILRINSPGGSVGASQELYQALVRFRESEKPIVTSVIDICASGAYYAAAPSDYIVANSGSVIGSIGVILTATEFIELYKKVGIKFDVIKSGEFKDILSPARELTREEREHLQGIIDYSYQQFLGDVLRWRAGDNKTTERKITEAANGLIYNSQDAIDIGLIDAQGDLEVAKEKMAELLDIPYEDLKIRNDNNIIERLGIRVPFGTFGKLSELLSKLADLIPSSNKGLEYKY